MNKTKVNLGNDLILRSKNIEYKGKTLTSFLNEKNLMQVGITKSPFNYSSSDGTIALPFDKVLEKTGDKLTLVNNKIKVSEDLPEGLLKLHFQAYGYGNAIPNVYAYIYKNDVETADCNNSGTGTANRYYLSTDVYLSYKPGDVFYVKFGADGNTNLLTSYYRSVFSIEILK